MADNKKYYYLKLKDDFFEDESVVLLETMKDGYLYQNILLKLYLKSLKSEGRLAFKNTIPYNAEMLASLTRHQVGTVERALEIFKELELIEILDNGAIYMLDIQNFIGESSKEADRIRAYRKRIEEEKDKLVTNVQDNSYKCTTNVHQRLEIRDKSLEFKDKDIYIVEQNEKNDIKKQKLLDDIYPLIDYLNLKSNKNFRKSNDTAIKLLNARLNDGYTVDDIKYVIDVKCSQWLESPDFNKYLRPETLFNKTKFENYINEQEVKKKSNNFHNFETDDNENDGVGGFSMDEINELLGVGKVKGDNNKSP